MMSLIELWNVLDKGLPVGSWMTLPEEVRDKSPEFMPRMGTTYTQGRWVLDDPEEFMAWAAGTGLWDEEDLRGMTPYVVAFLLRD